MSPSTHATRCEDAGRGDKAKLLVGQTVCYITEVGVSTTRKAYAGYRVCLCTQPCQPICNPQVMRVRRGIRIRARGDEVGCKEALELRNSPWQEGPLKERDTQSSEAKSQAECAGSRDHMTEASTRGQSTGMNNGDGNGREGRRRLNPS